MQNFRVRIWLKEGNHSVKHTEDVPAENSENAYKIFRSKLKMRYDLPMDLAVIEKLK